MRGREKERERKRERERKSERKGERERVSKKERDREERIINPNAIFFSLFFFSLSIGTIPPLLTYFPNLTSTFIDLLNKLLTPNPIERITIEDALNHPWIVSGQGMCVCMCVFMYVCDG